MHTHWFPFFLKAFIESQTKAKEYAKQLSTVKAQLSAREREKRLCELTSTELEGLKGENVKTYKAVGKM